jgi:hypothetical protein
VALVDNRNIRDGLVPDRSRQTNESEWTRLLIAKGYAVLAESERRPDAPPLVNAAATAAQEPAQPQPATSRPAPRTGAQAQPPGHGRTVPMTLPPP